MSGTVIAVYQNQPTFPATDQNPSAVRFQITYDAVSYWVDAVGGTPTSAEVGAALTPPETGFYTSNAQTADYTLALADADDMVEMNCAGANTLTIPLHSVVPFDVGTLIQIVQTGAGLSSIAVLSGATLNCKEKTLAGPGAVKTRGRYSRIEIYQQDIDVWVLNGDALLPQSGGVTTISSSTDVVLTNPVSRFNSVTFTGGGIKKITLPNPTTAESMSLGIPYVFFNAGDQPFWIYAFDGSSIGIVQIGQTGRITPRDNTTWTPAGMVLDCYPSGNAYTPYPFPSPFNDYDLLIGDATTAAGSFWKRLVASVAFTPVLSFGGLSAGITYGVRSGHCVRLGPLVFFSLQLTLTSKGSSTGPMQIGGLPFNALADGGVANLAFYSGMSGVGSVVGYVAGSGSFIALNNGGAATVAGMDNTNFTNTTQMNIVGCYLAA